MKLPLGFMKYLPSYELDLYPKFMEHDIVTIGQIMACDVNRLNIMGVKLGRCDRFLEQMQKQRAALLKQGLVRIDCAELYDTFNKKNIGVEKLLMAFSMRFNCAMICPCVVALYVAPIVVVEERVKLDEPIPLT